VASYKLLIKPSAAKELEALAEQDRKRTAIKIQRLGRDPRPDGAEKLSGQDRYRVRQGDYRILYAIDDPSATAVIVKIGHRRDVYR
jgi:mRNA interferase RelE/StbE